MSSRRTKKKSPKTSQTPGLRNTKAKNMVEVPSVLAELERAVGGKVDWSMRLPDGSGAATMSFPLPKDHWLTKEGYNESPMPFRMGTEDEHRPEWVEKIRAAAKYAVRASTMNGKIEDFDPDAMVQNFVVGMVGYYTTDGRSSSPIGR